MCILRPISVLAKINLRFENKRKEKNNLMIAFQKNYKVNLNYVKCLTGLSK